MAIPRGLNHFCSFLKGMENKYVLIGGGAAAVLMEEQGLEFRATKDIDLVILTNSSEDLNARIAEYLKLGKFKTKEATEDSPKYYRFSDPESEEFPQIIEIFARNELKIELADGQYIIPIQKDVVAQLSAILLDDEYFELIRTNVVQTGDVLHINGVANICLKARAYRELFERKGDEKQIKKHRNDVMRLTLALTGEERQSLGPVAEKDLRNVLSKIEEIPEREFNQIMEKNPGANKSSITRAIRTVFSLA